jgi:hypothetical protein
MGIYEGLDSIKKYKEEQEARKAAAEAGKINWLNIDDGETVKVWFLQELDRSAEGYNKEAGLGIMATEHSNPKNFLKKALCSMDSEGQCLGCEKHKEDWKAGWKQKSRLYINVLVERKNGDREVALMSQPNGAKSVLAPMLLNTAIDDNTITNRWWKVTRTGKKAETSYLPMPGAVSADIDPADFIDQLVDVKRGVREVPYDEQFDFYFASDQRSDESDAPAAPDNGWASKDATSTEEDW